VVADTNLWSGRAHGGRQFLRLGVEDSLDLAAGSAREELSGDRRYPRQVEAACSPRNSPHDQELPDAGGGLLPCAGKASQVRPTRLRRLPLARTRATPAASAPSCSQAPRADHPVTQLAWIPPPVTSELVGSLEAGCLVAHWP
jgi:hypothetical protein